MAAGWSMKLTAKQKLFVEEYLKDTNATQAAIRAGYKESSAKILGSRILNEPAVAKAIQEAMDKRSSRTNITADNILSELFRIATCDVSKAYDKDGHLLPIHEIPEDVRRAIASVKVFDEYEGYGKERIKVGEVREVKFWDKPKALEMLGRHLVLFTEKIEHSGEIKGPQIIVTMPSNGREKK